MECFDPKKDSDKLWETIKILNNKGRPPPKCAMRFSNETVKSASEITNIFKTIFTRQFSTVHDLQGEQEAKENMALLVR